MVSPRHPEPDDRRAGIDDTTDTLPALFWRVAGQRQTAVALRWNHLGIWNAITWADYADAVRAVGLGLLALGARRGDRAVLLSDVRPEWCQVDFGAMGIGVQPVALPTTFTAASLARAVRDSAARWLFVQDQTQLDKALAALPDMSGLERIFFFDGSGLHGLAHPLVADVSTVLAAGRTFHRQQQDRWANELGQVRSDHVATIAYTAGSTGEPKGVLLTHGNLMFQLRALERLCPGQPGDEQLAFLSPGAILERCFTVYRALTQDIVVHLGKGLPAMLDDLREVSPHVLMAVPRVWEKLYAVVTMGLADATPLQRWAYAQAMVVAQRVASRRAAGRTLSLGLVLRHALGRSLVLGRVRAMIGLRRARLLVAAAAPISPDLVRWFEALGLTMVAAYGQAECAGLAAMVRPGQGSAGSVGQALPGTELRLTPQGEVLVRGPHVFAGYLDPSGPRPGRFSDGWLHTGDRGRLGADGCLHLTDRSDDVTSGPTDALASPAEIESRLRLSPFIADAIVIGPGRPRVDCLLLIEPEAVARHVRQRQLVITGFANLSRAPEVRALIQREIDRVNGELGPQPSVGRFVLLDTDIGMQDASMTPTLLLRRRMVLEANPSLLANLHADPADGSPQPPSTGDIA